MAEQIAEEIFITTPHIRLAAKKWGLDDGTPVLGLHGWLDNANSFDRLAPLLSQLNLVCLDLPGHGMSEHRPPGMRYHYTDYLDDVMGAADALGWRQFTLLGHSMGAAIGCLAASTFPERVTQLLLIESLGVVSGDLDDVSGFLRRSVEAMKPKPEKNPAAYRDIEVLIRARTAAGNIRRDSAEILVQRAVKRSGGVFNWQSDQRLKCPSPRYFTNEVMVAFLQSIAAPVLLITGEHGTLRKRPYFQSRCEAIKNLRIVTLPGHHHLHLDDPIPVARAINGFLESREREI